MVAMVELFDNKKMQEICIKFFLKHIHSTPLGIPDILKQHYFSTRVSL